MKLIPDSESARIDQKLEFPAAMIPIVGIGASAGGLDVFKRLLDDLPSNTGFAIVFVQHLDPNHHSILADILSRATSMPVSEAADGVLLEADHIYVIPENADMTLAGGTLKLVPRTQAPGTHLPIDRFLRSLAQQRGSKAIGVILSGSGSDGAAGVEAIRAAGGMTFAQDAASAKVSSMPRTAVATGCVDFILPPEGIVSELVRIGRHPYIADALSNSQPPPYAANGNAAHSHAQSHEDKQYGHILDVLHAATNIDFSLYREKMIKRRILRRLALRNMNSLAEYSGRFANDSDEIKALQHDLLISVTSFFRDPETFESLKNVVFPKILQGRPPHETIRVWVAGCATGEEAYSIAISLQEYLSSTGAVFPVQIFASDISQAAIDKARIGKYLDNIAADVSHERLNRCFTKIAGGYQINKNLREMCVFTRHNLIDDPPFSKLDLITCRNVLIYLGSVQKNIVSLFQYALKPAGFLLLGASEGPAVADLFSEVDGEHRIYAKREGARRPHSFPSGVKGLGPVTLPGNDLTLPPNAEPWDRADVRKQVDRILLSKYSPPAVVVDENLEVVEIRGKASPYLTLPAGKVSFNLVKLISDTGLFLQVERLIQQVRKTGEPARHERVPSQFSGTAGNLTLDVVPLDFNPTRSTLVVFEAVSESVEAEFARSAVPEADILDQRISQLTQQLADAKERFLSSLETHQASAEECQTATEEALSANEELQSLNEELETAKEELQSTNEELITLNDELQAKNAALAQARDFAMSIVETIRQPLVVLDTDLRVKIANKSFYEAFQTSPLEAEGQMIYSLSHDSWNLPGLRDSLNGLLNGAGSFPDFEVQQDFPGLGRKSLVVGGCHLSHLKMILLAIDDITQQKLAQQALRESEDHLRQAQKMEAVGRLAGGIAHDFNNLLTAILGYSGLLLETSAANGGVAGNAHATHQVLEIQKAGERAASLTKQLLAYSRRQVLQPKVLDLNAIVTDMDKMLRRLVGERIHVVLTCDPDLWKVCADPGEIGRALLNLSLNARDAMPEGGTLTIGTINATLDVAEILNRELAPGRYVAIIVHDTGLGIDEDVQTHIFEPFFTTKPMGKGTGLGLATVLGIVEQSGGAIRCESQLGKGTTFTILLPAVTEPVETVAPPAESLALVPKGTGVILLVEDEKIVRVLARQILVGCGYVVIEARNGREGLKLCKTHDGPIDLLISDVVMPELNGRELAEGAIALRPNLKIVFMSGHTEDVVLKEGIQKGTVFLQKPFLPVALAQAVRTALDSSARSVGAATAP